MPHESAERNPFMLMLNPEVILAAVEKSERLRQLNRHLCRPLDRAAPATTTTTGRRGSTLLAAKDADEADDSEPF